MAVFGGSARFQKRVLEDLRKRRIDILSLLDKSQEEELKELAKSDERKQLIAGLLRYNYPVKVEWVSNRLCMGHFTTVSKAMRFFDNAEGQNLKQKNGILKFIDPFS
jgi:hypothetical protein